MQATMSNTLEEMYILFEERRLSSEKKIASETATRRLSQIDPK